jgi:outer membrane protein OmpA-like peptidoglycan-associated protein
MTMIRNIAAIFVFLAACLPVQVAGAQGQSILDAITKTVNAIGYDVGGGKTTIDFKGTELMPQATGTAKVKAKKGYTEIEAAVKNLAQPTKFGAEFLTYVLWAASTEGSANNLGELIINKDGNAKLKVSTRLSVFSLLVTAEPYFAVGKPSEILVLENEIQKNTKGRIIPVNDYKLLKKAQYQKLENPLSLSLDLKNVPIEMYEARNAVEIARSRGAEKDASEVFAKAETSLQIAERSLENRDKKRDIISKARQAVQFSEDARVLATQRQEEARIKQEREAAAANAKAEAEAKAATDAAEAKRKADAEAKHQAELAAAKEELLKAEQQRQVELAAAKEALLKTEQQRQAAMAAAREAQIKAEADAAAVRAKAEADALKAKEEAANAEAERARRAAEALRSQLLEQFSRILETHDTPRGLVVNMADVLFDTGKYDLRQLAREKLARLAGIILAHPGLKLEVEGHTDSTGTDMLNQRLSEQRGASVRDYLIEQGLSDANITSKGFGETMPVADNSTAAGRQKNRRVEIIVSGVVIGTAIGEIRR